MIVGINKHAVPAFNDYQFALDLLEHQHVLLAPGGSFNVPYDTHFRITLLPRSGALRQIFARINTQLEHTAAQAPNLMAAEQPGPSV